MVGQKLEIKNSDAVLHNIKAVPTKNRGFNISQPTAGMTTDPYLRDRGGAGPAGVQRARLDARARRVVTHPFFAASGTDGTFSIKGLPPAPTTHRGVAREVRHADGDGDRRGQRDQDDGLHVRPLKA